MWASDEIIHIKHSIWHINAWVCYLYWYYSFIIFVLSRGMYTTNLFKGISFFLVREIFLKLKLGVYQVHQWFYYHCYFCRRFFQMILCWCCLLLFISISKFLPILEKWCRHLWRNLILAPILLSSQILSFSIK